MSYERTNVVIGAASGMGLTIARRLSDRSANLLVADIDLTGVQRVAENLGCPARVAKADLTDRASLDALAEVTADLGVLVVTAGLSPTMGDGRRIFDVNLRGVANALAAFEPTAREGTVAVVFSSMAGHMAPPNTAIDAALDDPLATSFFDDLTAAGVDVDEPGHAYSLSKRGVQRLARHAAVAWARHGARVLSLSPGIVDTPMGRLEAEARPVMTQMVAASALGRAIDVAEIAAVVDFLTSPAAAAITGTDVLVDGGVIASLGL